MSEHRIETAGLSVARELFEFIADEALPETGVDADSWWRGFAHLLHTFTPRIRALLARRDVLQAALDKWSIARKKGSPNDHFIKTQRHFLTDIGYLVPEGPDFTIGTRYVDREVSSIAGPQLVVPLSNIRYALNAVNARWGSLYDALYGTDAIDESGGLARSGHYNPQRGAKVVERGRALLDLCAPLTQGSHSYATAYAVRSGRLEVAIGDGVAALLRDPLAFAGYRGAAEAPSEVLFRHNNLHVEVVIDRTSPIGSSDAAGIADILMEAALTTILDLEDSVAAVDAREKVALYRNMLGLVRGHLIARFAKAGRFVERTLAPDRVYTAPSGDDLTLSGRSLMFFRNVGHLMTTDAVRLLDGTEAPEGIVDGAITALIGHHERRGLGRYRNSRTGSIYIVKPKMHGPEEAAFANDLFDAFEDLCGHPRHTLKIGLMDEERRTSLNLKECIRAVKNRIVFINTGFLDRTGDEIHSAMRLGPVVRKSSMKFERWFSAYEENNVAQGLATGFRGRAQIGKGMWAMPDKMADMLASKDAQLQAGASATWVPSPTAATLHALHFHQIDVLERQAELGTRRKDRRDDLLSVPLADPHNWSDADIREEIENNCQSILGYVVRWIDQGIGCSKVPDIHNVGLMEDRATLRISSQMLTNWLLHGVCTAKQVVDSMTRMAAIVDAQNKDDPAYMPMSPALKSNIAFQTALDLVFKGTDQPNGYTEPLLHANRRKALLLAAANNA